MVNRLSGYKILLSQAESLLNEVTNNSEEYSDFEVEFYNQLTRALKIKDTSDISNFLESNITLEEGGALYDFMVDLNEVLVSFSNLNFDKKFDIENGGEYTKTDGALLAIALAINAMIEEVEDKTFPLEFFRQVFEMLDETILITDLKGNIKLGSQVEIFQCSQEDLTSNNIIYFIPEIRSVINSEKEIYDFESFDGYKIFDYYGNRLKKYKLQIKVLESPLPGRLSKYMAFRFLPEA